MGDTPSPDGAAYARAGVDIDAKARAFSLIRDDVRSTFTPNVLADVGLFGGFYALNGFRQPVLVSSADGVGTKLKIAFALDKHDTVGMDIVNHCVNDILTSGAVPLFFLDYLAVGRLAPHVVAQVVSGLAAACRKAGCVLIGGETAEMPDMYGPGEYDLAGFIVGGVERAHIIKGDQVRVGDVILGLPSSGLHTNGYSLVRQVFGLRDAAPETAQERLGKHYPELGRTLGEELLQPHRSYLPTVRPLLQTGMIHAMAHITGGGLYDNVPRVLPEGLAARFHQSAWQVPPIFDIIHCLGSVDGAEMYRVFNMGVGFVLVVGAGDVQAVLAKAPEAAVVGAIAERNGGPAVVID